MCRPIMSDFEPDETTSLLFDVCDILMDALDTASQTRDKQTYEAIKNLLVQTAGLIDAKAEGFNSTL